MATLLLQSNAKFRPYSLDEYLKPYQLYTEAYNKVEDQLTDLETQSNIYQKIAEQNPKSDVANLYNSFSNDLRAQADALATTGKIDRTSAMRMKARFASEIMPIAEAYKSYQSFNKERNDMRMKDNSIIFNNMPSIDDFLYGKSPVNDYISTNDISKNLALEIDFASRKELNDLLSNGVSYDKALQQITSGNSPRMQEIINKYSNNPRYQMTSPKDMESVNNAIMAGLNAGLSGVLKENTYSRKEKEALDIQKANLNLSTAREQRQIEAFNYKQNRNKTLDSLRLKNAGYKEDENGNLVLDKESIAYKEKIIKMAQTPVKNSEGEVLFTTKGRSIKIDKNGKWSNVDDTKLSENELGQMIDHNKLSYEQKKEVIKAYNISLIDLPKLAKYVNFYEDEDGNITIEDRRFQEIYANRNKDVEEALLNDVIKDINNRDETASSNSNSMYDDE